MSDGFSGGGSLRPGVLEAGETWMASTLEGTGGSWGTSVVGAVDTTSAASVVVVVVVVGVAMVSVVMSTSWAAVADMATLATWHREPGF